ncbi:MULTISPECIES: hypothetical protein [unclassified Streptomyces]|uniref:hypothetical protein n=1 Tax=unclassified Streptomyces TaxID=2593676 RepID=UPI000372057B|nr:hypothetical protein [Streptomyces sp. BoleA5]
MSQFFTKGKGASFETALRHVVQSVQADGVTDVQQLKAIAGRDITRRTARPLPGERVGGKARVRTKDITETPGHSAMARAGKQHLASGGSRLAKVIAHTAAVGGNLAFTVRARKGAFTMDAGRRDDSPGLRRNVVQRRDGSEERAYGKSLGAGQGPGGFDAQEFKSRVDRAGGDVTAAIVGWLVETGRLKPGSQLTHLEIRGWKTQD